MVGNTCLRVFWVQNLLISTLVFYFSFPSTGLHALWQEACCWWQDFNEQAFTAKRTDSNALKFFFFKFYLKRIYGRVEMLLQRLVTKVLGGLQYIDLSTDIGKTFRILERYIINIESFSPTSVLRLWTPNILIASHHCFGKSFESQREQAPLQVIFLIFF